MTTWMTTLLLTCTPIYQMLNLIRRKVAYTATAVFSVILRQDIDDVITKAKQVGVAAVLAVTESVSDFSRVLDLAERYPDFVLPCLGLHPVQPDEHSADPKAQRSVSLKDLEEAEAIIEQHHEKLAAIGEIGLDFTPRVCKTSEDRDVQKEVFARQVKMAQRFDLPVNVHSRSAGIHAINLLKELGASKVLLHAFDGKAASAQVGVDAGFFFSVPASICRSPQKEKLVAKVPISHLMLETDSPALSPTKMERNVPSNIAISWEYVAKIKKLTVPTVKEMTTENAIRLFPKISKFVHR
ncbi:putative deoxyribonuclease TATDN3 isoform X2 [Pomacea canaliculata]|uniref:putative deoxyribonuclease TATDN3 isoform X2 n=1 Tax=Pomacea canaliculata TaxID=400727 RepID=UPI000D73B5F6|nr:putative deoxyribonuclease TATDN3 isoform X2 [Pomacea canaliculata]